MQDAIIIPVADKTILPDVAVHFFLKKMQIFCSKIPISINTMPTINPVTFPMFMIPNTINGRINHTIRTIPIHMNTPRNIRLPIPLFFLLFIIYNLKLIYLFNNRCNIIINFFFRFCKTNAFSIIFFHWIYTNLLIAVSTMGSYISFRSTKSSVASVDMYGVVTASVDDDGTITAKKNIKSVYRNIINPQ